MGRSLRMCAPWPRPSARSRASVRRVCAAAAPAPPVRRLAHRVAAVADMKNGFAFATMQNDADAEEMIKRYDKTDFQGRRLNVEYTVGDGRIKSCVAAGYGGRRAWHHACAI